MLETSARLLRLLALLQSRKDWPGAELAERLQVSTRTIRNDIDRLRQLGYPVEAVRGVAGGYRLGIGANVPPLLLDDEEAVAVVVGLTTASSRGIGGIEEASLRAIAKIRQVLPHRLQRRSDALHSFATQVPTYSAIPEVSPQTLALLASACRDQEKMRLTYRSHAGETTRRIVEPHRLANWGQRWYLVAWDDERRDWRTFRLDRIDSLTHTGLRFGGRALPESDLSAYIARTVSRAGWTYQARFRVAAPAEVVRELINPAVGTVEPIDDDTSRFEAGADSLEMIAVYIGLLGIDFTVESPPELIAYLDEISERYRRAIANDTLNAGSSTPKE